MGSSACDSSEAVVVCAYPRKADDGAPEETMLTLFPDGCADGGVGGEPVYAYEDVSGGEVEPEVSQGLGVASSGHCLGKQGFIPIRRIYLFLAGTELSDFMECLCPPISLLTHLAHNVLPFITHRTLPTSSPSSAASPPPLILPSPLRTHSCSRPRTRLFPLPLDPSSSETRPRNANKRWYTSPPPQSSQKRSWRTRPPPTTAPPLSLPRTRVPFRNGVAREEPTRSTGAAVRTNSEA